MVVLVTGGSSGIGKATAQALRDAGCKVYEGSRRESSINGITHLTLDVTDEASAHSAVEQIVSAEGRLDILVNCAGSGISGAVEFTPTDEAEKQMDINFFGTVNFTAGAFESRSGNGIAAQRKSEFLLIYRCRCEHCRIDTCFKPIG